MSLIRGPGLADAAYETMKRGAHAEAKVYLAVSPGRGRGVFARSMIAAGEIIEEAPVIPFCRETRARIDQTELYNYYYFWDHDGSSGAIALGYGSLYNHSTVPNASFERRIEDQSIVFRAVRSIAADEEITINYKSDPRFDVPLWFEPT